MLSAATTLGRAAASSVAARPSPRPHLFFAASRSMSIFDSIWTKKKTRKRDLKYDKRLKPLNPDHDKDMPIFDYTSESALTRVYTWGMACYGALGVKEYVRPLRRKRVDAFKTMHRPARCARAEARGVVDVACGYGFTVFALGSKHGGGQHHIMGTGVNSSGQLGYVAPRRGHPLEILIQPVGVGLPLKTGGVRKVAAGRAHTLAAADNGDVFSLGDNSHGQCGRPVVKDEDYFRNRVAHRVRGPWQGKEDGVADIHCGQDHSIFRLTSGRLFSCGLGADGQTGLGHYNSTGEVTEVVGDVKGENIVKVATSADCVLAINDNGDVFGWGNSEYGQFSSVTSEQQVCTPVALTRLGVGRVVDVACGGTVCLILNDNYDVFVWGYGILGKGPNLEYAKHPVQLPNALFGRNEFCPEVRVRSVHAGVHACAAVNTSGELFTWGKNKGSCLGLGDDKDQYFPLRVSLINEVKRVSLGVDHTAVLCKPWT